MYKAFDNETGCEVAWNVMKTNSMTKAELESLRDEIKMIQQLNHENIINFKSAWYNKDQVVFITEIMTGGSLKQYLKRFKRPHLKVVKQWCRSILKGLHYLHSTKPYAIIHRDLKPDNIFVSSATGELRIGDLGQSTFMKNSYTKTIIGTPQYMAPEVFEEHYGPSADIWSFGLCLLEIVTSSVPYSDCKTPVEIYKQISQGVKPSGLHRILDAEVKDFLNLCLVPADQRLSAQELLSHSFLSGQENPGKLHLPVEVVEDCSVEKYTPTLAQVKPDPSSSFEELNLSIRLGIRDSEGTKILKVEFPYNLSQDTPSQIAKEILCELNLPEEFTNSLTASIQEKLTDSKHYETLNLSFSVSSLENLHKIQKHYEHKVSPFSSGNISPIEHEKEECKEHIKSVLELMQEKDDIQFPPLKQQLSKNKPNDPSDVKLLQEALSSIMNVRSKLDGHYGKKTECLVKRFQENAGFIVNGVVNKPLWDHIMTSFERKKKWGAKNPVRKKSIAKKPSQNDLEEKLIPGFT